MPFDHLPELVALDGGADGIRIPPDVTVPVTERVRSLIDTPALRRLTRISQLGLVAAVYPGATHSRFEHSLGVYRLALEFLSRLRHEPRCATTIDEHDAAAFVVAALVHDIGHWAFCHPLEDMALPELPRHESLVHPLLTTGELAARIEKEWEIAPARVASLVAGTAADPAGRLLCSLLSGPIDVDKMDYLSRDSLHAGVPYGRHFDQERLLSSLCLDETGGALAITEKGRTAAELMVFARYVMFSEVYWHHAVRAATAMLQRSIWLVRDFVEPAHLTRCDDREFGDWLVHTAHGSGAAPLVDGLFGPTRRLVKRAGSFDALHHPQIHRALAGRTYADSVAVSGRLAERLSRRLGRAIAADTLLIDAPPVEREVEFRLAVRERTAARSAASPYRWRSLAELSPVVRSLAHEQFDSLVKRVRLFAPAESAAAIAACDGLEQLILDAAGK
jgi:uncharacterized protein